MLKNLITVLALAIPVLLTGCLQASSGYAPSESEIKAAMATALQQQNRYHFRNIAPPFIRALFPGKTELQI